jgi:ATP-dependent helicase/nuclease subunit B
MRRINLFTIPAGLSFADELARGVLQRFGSADDPLAISRALILLPTRRSIRTLGEAFARVSPAGVCALPRMRALGDFDEPEERTSDSEDEAVTPDLPTGLAEPLKALKRELLLTKLIQHWSRAQGRDGSIERIGAESPALALRLARFQSSATRG